MTPELDPKGTVLLVEDNPDDVALTLRAFNQDAPKKPLFRLSLMSVTGYGRTAELYIFNGNQQ